MRGERSRALSAAIDSSLVQADHPSANCEGLISTSRRIPRSVPIRSAWLPWTGTVVCSAPFASTWWLPRMRISSNPSDCKNRTISAPDGLGSLGMDGTGQVQVQKAQSARLIEARERVLNAERLDVSADRFLEVGDGFGFGSALAVSRNIWDSGGEPALLRVRDELNCESCHAIILHRGNWRPVDRGWRRPPCSGGEQNGAGEWNQGVVGFVPQEKKI